MAKWHITFTNMGVWHNIEAPTKQKAEQIVLNMLKEINAENSTHIQCITLQSAAKKELERGLNRNDATAQPQVKTEIKNDN